MPDGIEKRKNAGEGPWGGRWDEQLLAWMGRDRLMSKLDKAFTTYLLRLGFLHLFRCQVHGPSERLHLGRPKLRHSNAIFNTRSGHIYIGDRTVVGHNCMFLTGRHEFEDGVLKLPRREQVPESGHDIRIGSGCWIASGAIVIGGVTIGDNSIIAAGAVVTRDVGSGRIAAGVPARDKGPVDGTTKRPAA